MPPILAPIAMALTAGAYTVTAASLTSFVVGTALSIGASYALGRIFRKKPPAQASLARQLEDIQRTVRSPVAERQIIYGRAMVSGPIAYAEQTGSNKEYLWLALPLAGHEIDAVEEAWLNDKLSTDPAISAYVSYWVHPGTATQSADANLIAASAGKWTSAHQLKGIAYLVVRLQFNADAFPTGLPNIRALSRGKKVYDPRTDTTVWSNNWALCVRDWMLDSDYGCGLTTADIDDATFIAAANISDESVSVPSGNQPRYTCDGVVLAGSADPWTILESMLTAGAGYVTRPMGLWGLYAGAYRTPTVTYSEKHLRAQIAVRPRPQRSDLFNAVKGTFADASNGRKANDFQPQTNATYETQDGGSRIYRDINLPWTSDPYAAQRIAKIVLEKSRQGMTATMPMKRDALQNLPGETVLIDNTDLGWSAKPFMISELLSNNDLTVDYALQEEASAVYAWASGDATTVDPAPDTNLPDPFTVAAPTGFALASGTAQLYIRQDKTVFSRIKASWAVSDQHVTSGGRIEVQYKQSADATWENAPQLDGAATFIHILDVQDGVAYDVRVRAVNNMGVRSSWVTSSSHTVLGKTARPSDVNTFMLDGKTLSWSTVSDSDLDGYRLRYQPGLNRASASWGNALPMHEGLVLVSPFTPVRFPDGQVTIMVKAVDTSGNESENAAVIQTDLGDPLADNVVFEIDQHAAGFVSGTITNGSVDGGSGDLIADISGSLIWNSDDTADMWLSVAEPMWITVSYEEMLFEITLTSTNAENVKMLISEMMVGDITQIEYRRQGPQAMWLEQSANLIWNAAGTTLMWDIPDYQPWPGEITSKYEPYDFRFKTGFGKVQGRISALKFQWDFPDIVEKMNDQAIALGGTWLYPSKAFAAIQNVGLTLQDDGGSAISARVDSKLYWAVLVQCFDSNDAQTTGSVDATIQGY